MQTRAIGHITVSLAGLGCNNFGRRIDEEASRKVVDAAVDTGITCYDTADAYGDGRSEEFLGRALGPRRDDVVIVSKFGMRAPPDGLTGGHPAWVGRACDESLARLGTDRIDVYLLHQPDPATPIGDTIEAMGGLVESGKVREIGCSNFTAALLDEAAATADAIGAPRFATVQNEYSLLHREPEREVLPACGGLGISFMPFFPLAAGTLTGKYARGGPPPAGSRLARPEADTSFLADERLAVVEQLEAFATSRGHTALELALSWLTVRPEVATVIAGATTPEQVRANVAATGAWTFAHEELAEIDEIARPADLGP